MTDTLCCFRSVTKKGWQYPRDYLLDEAAGYLGFDKVSDAFKERIKSVFRLTIRRKRLYRNGNYVGKTTLTKIRAKELLIAKLVMDNIRTIILMGGGLDSSYIAMYLLKRKNSQELLGLHFDYGHPGAKYEWEAIKALSNYLKFDAEQEEIRFPLSKNGYEVLGRNLYLILAASAIAKKKNYDQIALGVHKGSHYYDCSQAFLKDMQRILNGYFQDTIQLITPLIGLQKNEIFKLAQVDGLPLNLLYSCDEGKKPICKRCLSCRDWIALNAY